MEDNLSCAVCRDLYEDPFLTDCDHSFYQSSISRCREKAVTTSCPVCRTETFSSDLRPIRALSNNMETFVKCAKSDESQQECSPHKEKVQLFGKTDNQSIAVVCQTSRNQPSHKMLPLKETAKEFKEELRTFKKPVQDKKEQWNILKCDYEKTLTHIQKLPAVPKRVKQTPRATEGLINVGKYIGSLQYRVWKKMLTAINTAPVTFDPNTAHPNLLLSEDLRNVRYTGKRKQLPDNPERFDYCACVLGSEGFTSGKHSWEVEVGIKADWDVGVAMESINRKGKISNLNPGNGYWTMVLREGNEYWACENLLKRLELSVKPRKIRVCLDYEGGKVSFYNSDNKSHMYTFTATFTEKLYPYFCPCITNGGKNTEPLKICPRTVTTQEDESFIPSSK
ncbi:nuclear factor 7, ovary-like isoform X2 [Carcharodon carcharias]|uniref:nuclear factor 7, ovary-like isoform X2 n=1 Tax=Carcharodon carcharias TaxID=13397 RepID=UPI001B7DF6E3|nr:nuclear factor 7, ovary-like isoform X2 [Carcharodon carcharias]